MRLSVINFVFGFLTIIGLTVAPINFASASQEGATDGAVKAADQQPAAPAASAPSAAAPAEMKDVSAPTPEVKHKCSGKGCKCKHKKSCKGKKGKHHRKGRHHRRHHR